MKTTILASMIAAAQLSGSFAAVPLTQGTFTEIIRNVNRLSPDGNPTPAKVNEVVHAPERVRTGAQSRAELTAPDKTITRIGANTVFAFDTSGRVLHLDQGSVLFHAPKGHGGGIIKSGGASAAVLGTTIIVSATEGGGFKLIVLEGKAKATLENGKTATLKAGQLVFVLPGGEGFSQVVTVNLGKLAGNSKLVTGFAHPLPSLPLINAAIEQQLVLITSGKLKDTGVLIDTWHDGVASGEHSLDPGMHQTSIHPPLPPRVALSLEESPKGSGGPGGSSIQPVSGQFNFGTRPNP
jgi:hypothetical protein